MFGIAIVPAVLLALGMAYCPESPRWLYKVGYASTGSGYLSVCSSCEVLKCVGACTQRANEEWVEDAARQDCRRRDCGEAALGEGESGELNGGSEGQ